MPVQTSLVETENAKEAFTSLAFLQLLLPEPDFATHRDSEICRLMTHVTSTTHVTREIILTQVAQNPPAYLNVLRLYLQTIWMTIAKSDEDGQRTRADMSAPKQMTVHLGHTGTWARRYVVSDLPPELCEHTPCASSTSVFGTHRPNG